MHAPRSIGDRLRRCAIGLLWSGNFRASSLERRSQRLQPVPKLQCRFAIIEVIAIDRTADIRCNGIDSIGLERSLNHAQINVRLCKFDITYVGLLMRAAIALQAGLPVLVLEIHPRCLLCAY